MLVVVELVVMLLLEQVVPVGVVLAVVATKMVQMEPLILAAAVAVAVVMEHITVEQVAQVLLCFLETCLAQVHLVAPQPSLSPQAVAQPQSAALYRMFQH
jgi:hypothetical protein